MIQILEELILIIKNRSHNKNRRKETKQKNLETRLVSSRQRGRLKAEQKQEVENDLQQLRINQQKKQPQKRKMNSCLEGL